MAQRQSSSDKPSRLQVNAANAQTYVNQLRAEQAAFVAQLRTVVPNATVSSYIDENGARKEASYQVVFNGLSVDVGTANQAHIRQRLAKLSGVKAIYPDTPHYSQLYTSTQLINAPTLWNSPAIGGRDKAGAGIKFASIDGGVHHSAPMMNGAGYSYPPGFGPNGLGLTANNNGKIIASRAYFRTWDPPAPGDENPWPGEQGTSHGMHTSSTAAGNVVTDVNYLGFDIGTMSGVAPKAYVMSYRVFYYSVNGIESFYTTEGIAAIEDMVKDGADVVNNSWGGGPGSTGGKYDPLDMALINATKAGVFVSMSNGNAGPTLGTSDHPSDDYINVAASTTSGTLASGRLTVPADPNILGAAFAGASFGAPLPLAQILDFPYLTSTAVDNANVEGCNPFPANSFAGKAAVISRGSCEFGVKALNAQNAGANFVVIYNSPSGGEELIDMSPGAVGNQVTRTSIFLGHAAGVNLVNFYTTAPTTATFRINTIAFQQGNTPDQIINFSSRGPGVGNTLKPDIAAPGVNILAQGYAPGTVGEDRHLGYGQASGTSMASPHVAGAAALVLQVHPTWTPANIKSALMSTAKYMDMYLQDGTTTAQPLDMGAGRLDLTHATDPGVLLSPPSLSFGLVPTNGVGTIDVAVTSVATATEVYNLSTLYTGNGFTATTALTGFVVSPISITLAPSETKHISVTFTASETVGLGDKQGYIVLDGPVHDAHMPAWARVVPAAPLADVLIIDNDFSAADATFFNYLGYYTNALDALGLSYDILDYDVASIPNAAVLKGYKAILHFTGDNYLPGAGISPAETDRLTEYLNQGGTIIAMGQDMAATMKSDVTDDPATFYYQYMLAANWLQDSVTGNRTPTQLIKPVNNAPAAFKGLNVDLTEPRQADVTATLDGITEVPSTDTDLTADLSMFYDIDLNELSFSLSFVPSDTVPITLTAAHIHAGAIGVNGPVLRDLFDAAGISAPLIITRDTTISGVITPSLNVTEAQQFLNGETYANVHSSSYPGGAIRAQVEPAAFRNQNYVDEIDNKSHNGSESPYPGDAADGYGSVPLFYYPSARNIASGTVSLAHRQQMSLEQPGITYKGRSIYATFGLEGMNTTANPSFGITPTNRSQLLDTMLKWAWDEPVSVTVTDTAPNGNNNITVLTGALDSGSAVSYRWDFGDGSAYTPSLINPLVSHVYDVCGSYTVRLEVTDRYGTVSIGSKTIDVNVACTWKAFLPAGFN